MHTQRQDDSDSLHTENPNTLYALVSPYLIVPPCNVHVYIYCMLFIQVQT